MCESSDNTGILIGGGGLLLLGLYLLTLTTKQGPLKHLKPARCCLNGSAPPCIFHINVPVGAPRSADMAAPEPGDGDPAQWGLLHPGTVLQIRPAQSTLKSLLGKYF